MPPIPPASEWAALPFAVSLLYAGMPHGAGDAAVLRHAARGRPRAWLRRTALVYLGIDLAAVLALLLVPAATLAGFLVLTAWHFGHAAADRDAAPPAAGVAAATLLVAMPFAVRPAESLALFDLLTRLAGGDAFWPAAVLVARVACPLAAGWLVVDAVRRQNGRGRALLLLATLLAAPFLLPPIASVGLLFLVLHATPECVDLTRRLLPGDRGAAAAVLRAHRLALPLWGLTLLLLLPCWLPVLRGVRGAGGGPVFAAACLTLLAYAVLTPAHEWLRVRARGA